MGSLAVLRILERDPFARIVFLPADHYVRDEAALGKSLRAATTVLTRNPRGAVLVGIEPEEVDPDLGYILPGSPLADGTHDVVRFVEKPDARAARELLGRGALWNSFIFAASGPALVGMMRERIPEIVDSMATALARDSRSGGTRALEELYEELPPLDFSRAVLQGSEEKLRVIKAAACGWSDLGTPRRVSDTLKRIEHERLERPRRAPNAPSFTTAPAFISLAAQHARLGLAG
jgi:mannose-1-phosphate guanylyltransferase